MDADELRAAALWFAEMSEWSAEDCANAEYWRHTAELGKALCAEVERLGTIFEAALSFTRSIARVKSHD